MKEDVAHPQTCDLTAVVLTRDAQRLLDTCLASLAFCRHILVVDCGSADGTLDIASRHNARIVHRDWTGFADQFTFAASLVTTPYFLIVDSDEIVSQDLAASIRRLIQSMPLPHGPGHQQGPQESGKKRDESDNRTTAAGKTDLPVAWSVDRRSWYFDRFMRAGGWSPDHVLRLFVTGKVSFSQDAHIHYHPQGPTSHIADGRLIHYPYSGFHQQLAKLNVYADQGAADMRARGKRGGVVRGLGHALARFFRIYVCKRGFLDGRAGFIAAAHGSFYAFLKYVRVLDASWGEPYDHQ